MCLADYCDIIRCDVLKTQDEKIVYPDTINTDIEIWREASTYRTDLVPASSSSKDLNKYKRKDEVLSPARRVTNNNNNVKRLEHCQKYEGPDGTTENSGR